MQQLQEKTIGGRNTAENGTPDWCLLQSSFGGCQGMQKLGQMTGVVFSCHLPISLVQC